MSEGPITSFGPDDYVQTNNAQQQSYCDQYNREAYNNYALTIANLNRSLDAGRPAPFVAPKVPTKWVLTAPDASGLQWQTTSSEPTGPVIPLHEDATQANVKVPNTIHVGHRIGGNWFSAGQNDTFPSGQSTPPITSEDGVTGVFVKYAAPVGPGWFLLQ